ncbi:MAG TPA: ABC transporter permease [Gemmatimonadaceae bacterium]|nr:ABC transporter permease [Gemmatimonadaceae bacterium]
MQRSTLVKEATESIARNKMRSLLTMLGIVIGVAAVIVMVAIGNGASQQIASSIRKMGTNVIMIMPTSTTHAGVSSGAATYNKLTVADAMKIKREATLVAAVSPVVVTEAQVIGGNGNWKTRINGVSADFFTIRDWNTSLGEIFTDDDVRSGRKVAVLGATVARKLFAGSDPIGARIQIGRVPFTVVGVLMEKGGARGGDEDDVVVMPYTTAQTRLKGDVDIGHMYASAFTASQMPAAQEEIAEIMRDSHKLKPGAEDDFFLRNQIEITEAMGSTTRTMSALLAAIASISLLVGGIGIMNIMLVSVTERTHEIGIRMAIGARGTDILSQFLVESIALSVFGGLVGLGCGYVGATLVARLTGWTVVTPVSAVVIAVGFSAGVGVVFGVYPARKAASLRPIEALRYE